MPGPWRRRSTYIGRPNPYRRQVEWVTQTQACQQFGLKPSDLEAISPLEVVANPHGGRHPMKKFALSQVKYLAKRLEFEKNLEVEIVRSRAMERYGLTPAQMDTLTPTKTKPNPHHPGTEMRFYSVKDVEKLVEKVQLESEAAAAKYASQPTPSSSNAVAGPSHYNPSQYTSHAGSSRSSPCSPDSSQTQPGVSGADSDDEYWEGGIDESILASIPLP